MHRIGTPTNDIAAPTPLSELLSHPIIAMMPTKNTPRAKTAITDSHAICHHHKNGSVATNATSSEVPLVTMVNATYKAAKTKPNIAFSPSQNTVVASTNKQTVKRMDTGRFIPCTLVEYRLASAHRQRR
jgi:hypothetical protein